MESNKTLDSPSSKIIFKKTLGAYETFSSSCLGASSCSKSNVKHAKHVKSSFKNRHKSSDFTYSSSSTSSRNRSLTSTSLVNGEHFHVFSSLSLCVLIDVLLFYLSALIIMHYAFDKGKQNICMHSC